MNAIDVLGNVANGVMAGQDQINKDKELVLRQRQVDSAIQTQDLQRKALENDMLEKEKQRQVDDSFVPWNSVMPGYQQEPTSMKVMGTALKRMGLGDQVKEENGEVYVTNRAKRMLAENIKGDIGLASLVAEAKKRDLNNKIQDITMQIGTGTKQDGTKLKPEEIQELTKQKDVFLNLNAQIISTSHEWQMEMQKQRLKAKEESTKAWEPWGKDGNKWLDYNKITREYRDQDGNIVKPSSRAIPKAEAVAATGRSSTSTVIHNPAPYVDKDLEEFKNLSATDRKKYNINSVGDYKSWKANLKQKQKSTIDLNSDD